MMTNEKKKITDNVFLTVDTVMSILCCSLSKSYEIIQTLNEELKKKGNMTMPGRVSSDYFKERFNVSF